MVHRPSGPYRSSEADLNPLQKEVAANIRALGDIANYTCGQGKKDEKFQLGFLLAVKELEKLGFEKLFDFVVLEKPKNVGGLPGRTHYERKGIRYIYWANEQNLFFIYYYVDMVTHYGEEFLIQCLDSAVTGKRKELTRVYFLFQEKELIRKIKKMVPLRFRFWKRPPRFYRQYEANYVGKWDELNDIITSKSKKIKFYQACLKAMD